MMKTMKWAALSAALLGSSWFWTADPAAANKKMNVEEHVKELKDKLKLTPEQETKVREALEDKKRKIEDARQEAHTKIRDTLTEEQRNQFNDMVLKKEKDHDD